MQSDLPDSVRAFPKQRKEPLTDAQHVRNAMARFDQVIGVSDADRALAFANIEKACKLLRHQTRGNVMARSGRAATKGAVTRELRMQLRIHRSEKSGRKSQPTKTNLKKETEYDGHKRSDRSV
jgi:hypothetical protein